MSRQDKYAQRNQFPILGAHDLMGHDIRLGGVFILLVETEFLCNSFMLKISAWYCMWDAWRGNVPTADLCNGNRSYPLECRV